MSEWAGRRASPVPPGIGQSNGSQAKRGVDCLIAEVKPCEHIALCMDSGEGGLAGPGLPSIDWRKTERVGWSRGERTDVGKCVDGGL
jgi:hypothetical protein